MNLTSIFLCTCIVTVVIYITLRKFDSVVEKGKEEKKEKEKEKKEKKEIPNVIIYSKSTFEESPHIREPYSKVIRNNEKDLDG